MAVPKMIFYNHWPIYFTFCWLYYYQISLDCLENKLLTVFNDSNKVKTSKQQMIMFSVADYIPVYLNYPWCQIYFLSLVKHFQSQFSNMHSFHSCLPSSSCFIHNLVNALLHFFECYVCQILISGTARSNGEDLMHWTHTQTIIWCLPQGQFNMLLGGAGCCTTNFANLKKKNKFMVWADVPLYPLYNSK